MEVYEGLWTLCVALLAVLWVVLPYYRTTVLIYHLVYAVRCTVNYSYLSQQSTAVRCVSVCQNERIYHLSVP